MYDMDKKTKVKILIIRIFLGKSLLPLYEKNLYIFMQDDINNQFENNNIIDKAILYILIVTVP